MGAVMITTTVRSDTLGIPYHENLGILWTMEHLLLRSSRSTLHNIFKVFKNKFLKKDFFEVVWFLTLLKYHVFWNIAEKGALPTRSNRSIPHNIFKSIWEQFNTIESGAPAPWHFRNVMHSGILWRMEHLLFGSNCSILHNNLKSTQNIFFV